jgi:hypothetical protein
MRRASLLFALVLAVAVAVPAAAFAEDAVYLPSWPGSDSAATAPHYADPPVPANTPIIVGGGWIAGSRGLAQCAPTINDFFFEVRDSSGNVVASVTADRSGTYWAPSVVLATTDQFGDLSHFRAKIGAKPYFRSWDAPMGKLAAGTYSFMGGYTQKRPANDLLWYYPGQKTPLISKPATVVWYFTFDVTE